MARFFAGLVAIIIAFTAPSAFACAGGSKQADYTNGVLTREFIKFLVANHTISTKCEGEEYLVAGVHIWAPQNTPQSVLRQIAAAAKKMEPEALAPLFGSQGIWFDIEPATDANKSRVREWAHQERPNYKLVLFREGEVS